MDVMTGAAGEDSAHFPRCGRLAAAVGQRCGARRAAIRRAPRARTRCAATPPGPVSRAAGAGRCDAPSASPDCSASACWRGRRGVASNRLQSYIRPLCGDASLRATMEVRADRSRPALPFGLSTRTRCPSPAPGCGRSDCSYGPCGPAWTGRPAAHYSSARRWTSSLSRAETRSCPRTGGTQFDSPRQFHSLAQMYGIAMGLYARVATRSGPSMMMRRSSS